MIFKPPIAIGLSPNTQNDDVWQAIKILFQPWLWKEGSETAKAQKWFENYLGISNVYFFNSARSALFAILKSFGIGKGDEVLLQAFTCVAVPDPIIWTGAKPIFVDIDETLNIDPGLLEKHINTKTRAIIVQHTFGIPAKIEMITKIAQKYNLILIEDCAHSLGAEINQKKVGTFGDAAIFSFGRDKVISSVYGGMATINGKWKMENGKLKKLHQELKYPSFFWIFQQLLHPIAMSVILPLYNCYLGKLLLLILQKLSLLSKPVEKGELRGEKPTVFPALYPNALATLLLGQLNKLDAYNSHRKKTADYYFSQLKKFNEMTLPSYSEGAIYLRFNVLTAFSQEIYNKAKKKGILLGNWYKNTIDPKGVDFQKIYYKYKSCLKAERAARLSINLPTYPRLTTMELELITGLFNI